MSTTNEKSYFDLHISGIGYLNRIREVKPKKGEPFLACDAALFGLLWPLGEVVKLDATMERRIMRQQRDRLCL